MARLAKQRTYCKHKQGIFTKNVLVQRLGAVCIETLQRAKWQLSALHTGMAHGTYR